MTKREEQAKEYAAEQRDLAIAADTNLRDTFAAAALTGLYANRAWDDSTDAAIAEQAYASADAMLRERANKYPASTTQVERPRSPAARRRR